MEKESKRKYESKDRKKEKMEGQNKICYFCDRLCKPEKSSVF